jgi:hypothetical protein
MSTQSVLKPKLMTTPPATPTLNYIQRAILRRGHPRYMIASAVGAIWAFYFLWKHEIIGFLAAILIGTTIGRVSTWALNAEKFARTTLGKIMLLHLRTENILTQSVGAVLLIGAVWMHSIAFILAGTSLIFFGHLAGWHDVHDAL